MSYKQSPWAELKPKCAGCIYFGTDVPCEYFFIAGKTPQSQGVKLDPEGPGGCALKQKGKRQKRTLPALRVNPTRNKPSKLDTPKAMAMYKAKASDCEIADAFGVAASTVGDWRRKRGLPRNYGQGERPEANEYIVRSAESGELLAEGTAEECSERLGFCNKQAFYSAASVALRGLSGKYVVERKKKEGENG